MAIITTKVFFNRAQNLVALSLLFAILALPLQAAPPPGKGGGKGGGGGDGGGGPVPEMHWQWAVELPGAQSKVRPAVAADGTVYAVDELDNLVAVNPDGTVKWSMQDAGSKGLDIGPDGTVYTGNEVHIKAFNPDGSLKWTFIQSPHAFVLIDVAVGPDDPAHPGVTNVYAVATDGMGVFKLTDHGQNDVRQEWTTPEPYARNFVGYSEISFGPTQDGTGDQLYFFANSHTRAVELSGGNEVFSIGGGNTAPRVDIIGNWHRPNAAYDPSGNPVWEASLPGAFGATEPTLSDLGNHFMVYAGDVLHKLDLAGNEIWQTPLDEFVDRPDVNAGEDIVLLTALSDETHPEALLAVDAGNGSVLWRMEFPGDGSGLDQYVDSPVAYDASGTTAYVMTGLLGGNKVYLNAIATDPAVPSASTLLRSTDIDMSGRSTRKTVKVSADITVLDQNRGPVSGAAVTVTWGLPDGSTTSQTSTTSGGVAGFNVASSDGGTYYLTVDDISKDGYTFDASHSILQGNRSQH